MYLDLGRGTWILYIWIFILFWKAASLQAREQAVLRSEHEVLEKEQVHHKRLRHKRSTQDENIPTAPVKIQPSQDAQATNPNIPNSNKISIGSNSEENSDLKPLPLQKNIDSLVDGKPTPPPLNTNKNVTEDNWNQQISTSNIPPPLEVHIDLKAQTNGKQVTQENKTSGDPLSTTASKIKGTVPQSTATGTTTVKDERQRKNKGEVQYVTEMLNSEHPNGEPKSPSPYVNKPKPVHYDTIDPHKNTSKEVVNVPDKTLRFKNKKKQAQENDEQRVNHQQFASITEEASPNKDDPIQGNNQVPGAVDAVNVSTVSSQMNDQTILRSDKNESPAKQVKAKNDLLFRRKQHQSLILLQNVTKEADDLQKRLKNHKLKLKSYIDVLKNFTITETERNKETHKNYTGSVREKVNDILNPKRRLENKTEKGNKDEASNKHGKKPQHLLAKDIPDTLRARVDMTNIKKSQAFWDKKGTDIDEPLYHDEPDEEDFDMPPEDTISELSVIQDYSNDFPQQHDEPTVNAQEIQNEPENKNSNPQEQSAPGIVHEYHAKLAEVQSSKDRYKTRTHEMVALNQLVSGRIHGNVLAPPPERCSVPANMIRYRPPEEQMNEVESLLYRADLQPEIEKTIEGGPMDYLADYKNPCWLSKITDDRGSLWYDYTETGLTYKRMSFLYEMRLSKGSNWRMRCLPLVYFVGVTKSGTTDLYTRLMGHPEIMRPGHKEPMWWNRLTLGMAQSLRKPFRYYLDFFDEAAELIRRKVIMKDGKPYHPAITMDATPANLWDYDCWTDIPGNRGLAEPKYTLANSIKKLVPGAKILMILREPTSRLYSQYRMKSHMEPSITFHKQVLEGITNFNDCLKTRTLRSCAYDYQISKHEFGSPGGVFLRASLYYVFVKDWLEVFPPGQVMVVRSEDYYNNTGDTLQKVFDFLGVSQLTKDRLNAISKQGKVNTRSDHTDRSMEPMMPETQKLLDDFFRPYNRLLAKLLHNKNFKWEDVDSMYARR